MKKITFTILSFLLLSVSTYAQKTEFGLALNSGLFSFSGQSSTKTSSINYTEEDKSGATNNPYGKTGALCFGASADLKRITKNHFIIGMDMGYDVLRSKTDIDYVDNYLDTTLLLYSAKGHTILMYNFVNLHPYAGYRIPLHKVSLDVTGGLDIAFCVTAREQGDATSNGTKYQTSVDRKTIKTDVRPGLQVSASYKRVGVYAGYSFGLVNYKSGYIGGTNECYARLLRFGVTFRIL